MNASDGDLPIKLTTDGRVGIVELNRPQVYNCLTVQMLSDIRAGLNAFEDGDIRAVVILGAGKNFCTGASLDEVEAVRADPSALSEFLSHGHAVMNRIQESPLPIVAGIHGLCLAGGIELALACDVVFAADTANFGDQHAAFGLIPGWGGSQRLVRAIGQRRSMDLMFSARRVDAHTALEWGLVNYVCTADQLRSAAIEYAKTLSARNREGLTAMKRLALRAAGDVLASGLEAEKEEALRALSSANVNEGLRAFKERRTPMFT